MTRNARTTLALLTALLLAAHVPPLAAQQTATLPDRDRALEPPSRTLFTVGVADGAEHEMFGQVSAVAFDDDGRLYVLDRGSHRVAVFSPDGRFVRMFGRRGGGPGELQAPVGIAVSGDEVLVLDLAHGAIVVYDRDGAHRRNLPFDLEDRPGRRFAAHPRGGFVYEPMPITLRGGPGGPPQARQRDRLPVLWRGLDDEAVRTLYEAPAPEVTVRQESAGGGRVMIRREMPPVFTPSLQWAVLPDGGLVVTRAEGYRLEIVGPDGRTARVVERDLRPRRVAERDRERARALREETIASGAGVVAMGGGGPPAGQAAAMARQMLADMTFAETIPVIQAITVDRAGRIWVRRAGSRDYDRGPVDVITADGRYLGTFPEGTRLPDAFGPDGRTAYIEADELGVQRVVVRR